MQQAAASVNKSLLSINYISEYNPHYCNDYPSIRCPENTESSDYLKEGDVGFKKPKVCFYRVLKFSTNHLIDQEEAPNAQNAYRVG